MLRQEKSNRSDLRGELGRFKLPYLTCAVAPCSGTRRPETSGSVGIKPIDHPAVDR